MLAIGLLCILATTASAEQPETPPLRLSTEIWCHAKTLQPFEACFDDKYLGERENGEIAFPIIARGAPNTPIPKAKIALASIIKDVIEHLRKHVHEEHRDKLKLAGELDFMLKSSGLRCWREGTSGRPHDPGIRTYFMVCRSRYAKHELPGYVGIERWTEVTFPTK